MENIVHEHVATYLRNAYPDAIFRSDAAGIRLTMGQAVRMHRLNSARAYPDIRIDEARGGYFGLFIEVKRDGVTILKRNGEMVSDPHIREQAAVLAALRERGYQADFGVGFSECRRMIDQYLSQPITKPACIASPIQDHLLPL